MFYILISTGALIVLLPCVWCNSTALPPLIRLWRVQKGPTPGLNCFPWWHYWILCQQPGGETHQPISKLIQHPYYAVGFVLGALHEPTIELKTQTYTYKIIREQQRPNWVELTLSAVETQSEERSVWAKGFQIIIINDYHYSNHGQLLLSIKCSPYARYCAKYSVCRLWFNPHNSPFNYFHLKEKTTYSYYSHLIHADTES